MPASRNREHRSALELPLSRTMRFRDSNVETVQLVNPPLEFDGRAGRQGRQRCGHLVELRVRERAASVAGYARRADRPRWPICSIRVRNERPPALARAELGVLFHCDAREIGLSDGWAQRLAQHAPTRRQALTVVAIGRRLRGGSAPAAGGICCSR